MVPGSSVVGFTSEPAFSNLNINYPVPKAKMENTSSFLLTHDLHPATLAKNKGFRSEKLLFY